MDTDNTLGGCLYQCGNTKQPSKVPTQLHMCIGTPGSIVVKTLACHHQSKLKGPRFGSCLGMLSVCVTCLQAWQLGVSFRYSGSTPLHPPFHITSRWKHFSAKLMNQLCMCVFLFAKKWNKAMPSNEKTIFKNK